MGTKKKKKHGGILTIKKSPTGADGKPPKVNFFVGNPEGGRKAETPARTEPNRTTKDEQLHGKSLHRKSGEMGYRNNLPLHECPARPPSSSSVEPSAPNTQPIDEQQMNNKSAPKASLDKIYRTTKCFGVNGQGICKGSFPKGFLEWLKKMGWWGEKRCYLCSGAVDDASAIRVDVRSEVKPTHLEDATKTTIPTSSCNLVIIDPPYSLDLARKLYGTENNFHGIDAFTKEAYRICEVGGLIITLSYAIPKRIKGCNFLSVCGIYTVPFCGYMRCLTVSKKLM